ncbi:MAG: hypothetical protein QOH21_3646, partial [Acidobacteriota bacterium]|nr:hypothetical protein [Acidobacteriota bacterium]
MRFFLRTGIRVLVVALFLGMAAGASAQPFNAWLVNPVGHGWVNLPAHDYADGSFTFEAWVALKDQNGTSGCSSIAGNDYTKSIWIGVCGTNLRSYVRGGGSSL